MKQAKKVIQHRCDYANCIFAGDATWQPYELGYVATVLYEMSAKMHKKDKSAFHSVARRIGDVCPICKKAFY